MDKGLEGLKDLNGGAKVSEIGLDEDQVTQLASMLGKAEAEIEQIKGQTFKQIGEMATLKEAMDGGLEGLAKLSGDQKVDQIQINDLAKMLGSSVVEIQDKSFTQIGELAKKNAAAIKTQSAFRGYQARKAVKTKKEELKQYLQTEMDKGLEGLKDLNGPTTVGSLGLGEDQVKQLATMLGVETDAVGGKTFKDIGEMAQVITAIKKDTILIAQLQAGEKLFGDLEGLKGLSGPTTVGSLGLGADKLRDLAEMLGRSVDDIKDKSFTQIGKMAAAINIQYYSLKSVNNSQGTNRIRTQIYKVKARFGIAYKEAKVDGVGAGWNSLMSDKPNFDQALSHCEKFITKQPSNFPKDEMRILLDHNKYSLQEQCLSMNESQFNTHYIKVYDQMSFFGSERDALIKDLFKDIKIQGGRSPDFNKLYRGEAVNATNI